MKNVGAKGGIKIEMVEKTKNIGKKRCERMRKEGKHGIKSISKVSKVYFIMHRHYQATLREMES